MYTGEIVFIYNNLLHISATHMAIFREVIFFFLWLNSPFSGA
jgi:hypothetical protein